MQVQFIQNRNSYKVSKPNADKLIVKCYGLNPFNYDLNKDLSKMVPLLQIERDNEA